MYGADINIIGARLLVGNDLVEGGISIEEGKIIKIGKKPHLPKAEQSYDVKGLIAIPGLIDAHVHLRDLQQSYKEDFYTGTCAAAAGGFTTILDMPNNVPPTNSVENLRIRRDAAISKIIINVGFHAGLIHDKEELKGMRSCGVFSFKYYMNHPLPQIDSNNDSALADIFSTCALLKTPITIHPEDNEIIEKRLKEFKGKPLRVEDYSYIHGPEAELKSVKRALNVAGASGATVHLCHISLVSSITAIEEARGRGIDASCEFTPHHLFLSGKALERFGGWAMTDPPLRNDNNTKSLQKSLPENPFVIIASDHAPHSLSEKSSQDAREIKPGIPGLETTLPLMLTQVNKGGLSLVKLTEIMSERPARIFKLKGKGKLSEGYDADITLLDLNSEYTIHPEDFHSRAKYSPFAGQKCKGAVSKVYVGGQIVFDDGEIITSAGTGKVIEAGLI